MTDMPTARVRVFAPDELSGPEGWPEDVGIAVLQGGTEPEIFPVHRSECLAAVLARVESQTARNLQGIAVFPPVDGHPSWDPAFTADARLQVEIESFLSRTPAAVEEAADFSVNFGFAAEEGLELSALVRSPATQAAEPPAAPEPEELPGYAAFNPERAPFRESIPATLWLSPSGELVLVSDPHADPVKLAPSDVLVRDDGLALALRRSGPDMSAGLPGYILLPSGCLGFHPPSCGLQVLVMPGEKHYLVTPVLDWPEPAPDAAAPVADLSTRQPPRPVLSRGVAAFACITAGIFAVFLMNLGPNQPGQSASGPLPQLRAALFE